MTELQNKYSNWNIYENGKWESSGVCKETANTV